MIEITLSDLTGELGRIRILRQSDNDDGTADYSIEFAVDRFDAVGLHQRSIRNFPRLEYNVLGLLRAALMTLDEKELRLEDEARSSNLARRFRRSLPAFSRKEKSRVCDY